jgi:hypothetical protein
VTITFYALCLWSYHDNDGETIPLVSVFYRTHVARYDSVTPEVRVSLRCNHLEFVQSHKLTKGLRDQPEDSANYSKDDDVDACEKARPEGKQRLKTTCATSMRPTHDERYLSDSTPYPQFQFNRVSTCHNVYSTIY